MDSIFVKIALTGAVNVLLCMSLGWVAWKFSMEKTEIFFGITMWLSGLVAIVAFLGFVWN